jgi:hypothetical protein
MGFFEAIAVISTVFATWLGPDHGPRPVLAAGLVLAAMGLVWVLYRLVDPAAKARVPAGFRAQKPSVGACDPPPKSV